MKDNDFILFLDSLFGFFGKQVNFVKEYIPGDRVYGGTETTLRDPFYLFIFVEGIALGVTGIAFWGLWELLRHSYARVMRPKYYPQENARRRSLAAERRKIRRRRTLNAAPTAAELRAQYAKVRRNPKEMIRFGSMLCDLEAYVDNSLVRDEYGTITGRRPGIKGWLADHCPEMCAHYKTVIRYKALAEKFRQAVGLADPHPAAEALGDEIRPRKKIAAANGDVGAEEFETTVRNSYKSGFYVRIGKVREEAEMIVSEAGATVAGLIAALDIRLNPNMILNSRKLQLQNNRETITA